MGWAARALVSYSDLFGYVGRGCQRFCRHIWNFFSYARLQAVRRVFGEDWLQTTGFELRLGERDNIDHKVTHTHTNVYIYIYKVYTRSEALLLLMLPCKTRCSHVESPLWAQQDTFSVEAAQLLRLKALVLFLNIEIIPTTNGCV